MLLKLAELVVRKWFVNVTILTFETGEQAWAEILKTEPDLLITDMARAGMGGREMLPLLAEKNIKFPILVTSGSATEEQVRQVAGSKLKVAFLSKPYTQAEIFHWLAIFVGSSDNPQSHEL